MSEGIICLSDSEDSRHSDDKDGVDIGVFSEEFHYRNENDVGYASGKPTEEVRTIGGAGPSRYSELLRKYSEDGETVSEAGSRKKKNCENTAAVESVRADRRAKLPESGGNDGTRATVVAADKPAKRLSPKTKQPGDWSKFVCVRIDKRLINLNFSSTLLEVLRDSEISYELVSQPIANCITWKMKYPDESAEISTGDIVVLVWNWDEAARKIGDGSFASSLENIATLVPDKKIMLVVFGMGEYFRSKKDKGERRGKKIRREDLEMCLAEVQLTVGCSSLVAETSHELSELVRRLTKAIGELPSKLEKRQKLEGNMDWYASGDNRDTVKVDKNGNGLQRLWRQQLCQFNLSRLETAEAISSVYPCPLQLMRAYENSTSAEGERLLGDIPIRRAAGPLSTSRKVGPELSKKIFIAFTSKDGNAALANDR